MGHTGHLTPEGILKNSQVAIDFHRKIIAKLFQGKGWVLVALPSRGGRIWEGTEAHFHLSLTLTDLRGRLCMRLVISVYRRGPCTLCQE